MFASVSNKDLVILPYNNYIEVEFFSKYAYPFVEVAIIDRKDTEEDGPELYKFSSTDDEYFENTNLRWIFKLDTKEKEMPAADYHIIATGIDEDGKREEIIRFVIAIQHGVEV